MPGFVDPSVWLKDLFMEAGLGSGFLFLGTLTLLAFVFILIWLNHDLPANPGIFRKYAGLYLKEHPLVDKGQVVILLQSGILEHLIAILNEFGLKLFQQPAGYDAMASNTKQVN